MSGTKVNIDDLGKAIAGQLDIYKSNVADRILKLTKAQTRKLVKLTRQRAPKQTGSFRQHISSDVENNGIFGSKGTWYVKDPDYRLTHLLVHGHQTRSGGRTKPDDFLETSLSEVEDEYFEEIKKAVKE
ncbi:MAG: hypothetical protein UFA98_01105 [Ruminococcus sp.]|nr:hypothetical protein [Ruminococcus sp.]